jgi:GH25 family lysozyme M1 (1,4-beta-N-acetylmuramidase)
MEYGIDVSHHNGSIDWNAVHGNGITFAYIKATEWPPGQDLFVDPAFAGNAAAAAKAGITRGGYHFARPGDPKYQAQAFARIAGQAATLSPGSLAPVLDVEDDGIDDHWIKYWIAEFRAYTGIAPVLVYAGLKFWQDKLHPDVWADDNIHLICARYNGDPGNPGWTHPKLAIHQHTETGTVPGVTGNADRDATLGGYTIAQLVIPDGSSYTPQQTAPPAPQPAPSTDVYTVRAGDTLTSIARKFSTTIDHLVQVNKISDPNKIYIGQRLTY